MIYEDIYQIRYKYKIRKPLPKSRGCSINAEHTAVCKNGSKRPTEGGNKTYPRDSMDPRHICLQHIIEPLHHPSPRPLRRPLHVASLVLCFQEVQIHGEVNLKKHVQRLVAASRGTRGGVNAVGSQQECLWSSWDVLNSAFLVHGGFLWE